MKGKLIVFEGIDGAGKATQAKALARYLRARGERVTLFSSPRYDLPTGKLVRKALHGAYGNFVQLSPYISALPYLVDFAAWRDEIDLALTRGTVICDRYVQSTIAYHGAKLKGARRKEFVRAIAMIAFDHLRLPRPDHVILLDLPVAYAQKRIAGRKKDQHEKSRKYQRDVASIYGELARKKPWRKVECVQGGEMRAVAEIALSVRKAISR